MFLTVQKGYHAIFNLLGIILLILYYIANISPYKCVAQSFDCFIIFHVWIYHTLCICSPSDGRLVFRVFAFTNDAVINIFVQSSVVHMQEFTMGILRGRKRFLNKIKKMIGKFGFIRTENFGFSTDTLKQVTRQVINCRQVFAVCTT